MSHKRTCRAYSNYQPPYETCDCGDKDDLTPTTAEERETWQRDAAFYRGKPNIPAEISNDDVLRLLADVDRLEQDAATDKC